MGGPAALVLVNDDDLTYAKVRLDPLSLAAVRAHLGTLPAPLSRALVWSALWNATRDAALPAAEYLDVAFGQVGREPDTALLEAVLGHVGSAIERYLPAGARAAARARFAETCRAGAAAAEPGSDAQLAWARQLTRAASTSATGTAAVRGLLDGDAVPDGLRMDADLRWELLGRAGRAGRRGTRRARRRTRRRRHDDRAAGARAGPGDPTGHPGGDLAAGDRRRVAVQRPAARAGPRLQPPRPSPTNPGTRSATSTRSSAGGRPER